jgi:hypothetical protein
MREFATGKIDWANIVVVKNLDPGSSPLLLRGISGD